MEIVYRGRGCDYSSFKACSIFNKSTADLGRVAVKLNGFYQSPEWVKCRRAYIAHVGGLCERCKAKGIIQAGRVVHHKIRLTAENYTRPEISLSFQNLELLCQSCHEEEHRGKRRYSFTEDGMVVERRNSPPIE